MFYDILELNYTSTYQRIKAGLVLVLALCHIGLGSYAALFPGTVAQPNMNPVIWAGFFFFLLGIFAPLLAAIGVWCKKTARNPFTIEFTESEVRWTNAGETLPVPWDRFRGFYCTGTLIVLLVTMNDGLYLPKRAGTDEQIRQLSEFLQSKLRKLR